VFITNILKCRPPENRDPKEDEISACEPYLKRQLELLSPAVICTLGRVAAQNLLRTKTPLGKMRGKIHYYNGIKTIVTYHPAALLRNPHFKRPTWEDMKLLKKIYSGAKKKEL
ncbi:MAG TPA: uracil-DNA glycosylase, partial [Candidatus Krumholzibacteriaceae bacterium]|nr:uracil-DNA glycosylase [Candidatus Krumholzibacteriaceae bacterium]